MLAATIFKGVEAVVKLFLNGVPLLGGHFLETAGDCKIMSESFLNDFIVAVIKPRYKTEFVKFPHVFNWNLRNERCRGKILLYCDFRIFGIWEKEKRGQPRIGE